MKKFKLIFSAVVFTALFAGCGNSGDDPTPGPDPKPEGKEFHGVVFSNWELPNPEGSSGNVYVQTITKSFTRKI